MSELKEKVMLMLNDERHGVDEYKELADLAMKSEGLSENIRTIIAETFMSIRDDEAKHKQMLKFIYSML